MAAPPPAYDSVVQSLVSQTDGKQITIEQINNFATSLSSDQKAALANSPKPDPKNLNPDDVKAYHDKVVADALSPDAVEKYKQAARDAVDACKGIDNTFMSLYSLLSQIDSENGLTGTDQFLPAFGLLQNAWRKILQDSRQLAADVSVTAQRFDAEIMPVVADPTISQADKLKIIDNVRNDAQGYEARSEDINTRLGTLVDDFEKFVGTFGKWGEGKIGALNTQIVQARKDLDALLAQADSLKNTMIGFGVAVGVGAVIAVGGCFAGPLAPVFWVAGGLIAFTFGLGLLAVGLQYKNCMDDIDAKRSEITQLQTQVKQIEQARDNLQIAGQTDVQYIQAHIGAVTGIWTCLNSDLEQIVQWINAGQDYEADDLPPILKMTLVGGDMAKAGAIYAKVGEYLTEYSSGMLSSGIPDPK